MKNTTVYDWQFKRIKMETKRTDKEVLKQGLQRLGIAVFMMFVGPTLFYIATTNKEKPLYIPLLIISLLICGGAIYMAFRGLKTVMRSMFGKKTSSN